MKDIHLLVTKENGKLQGTLVTDEIARQITSLENIVIRGEEVEETDTFCEWLEIVSGIEKEIVGVCFTDFYIAKSHPVVQGLVAENVLETDDGILFFTKKVKDWKINGGPYLPVHYFRTQAGKYCYLIPSVSPASSNMTGDQKIVSTLKGIQ